MPTEIKFYSDLAMAYCPLKFLLCAILIAYFLCGQIDSCGLPVLLKRRMLKQKRSFIFELAI